MANQEPPEIPAKEQTTDEKLDVIIQYLHRIERRDHLRMVGSTVHSVLWLGSTILVLFSLWYFTQNIPQMVDLMTKQIIQQSMGGGTSTSSSGSWMEQLQNYMKGQR